MGKVQTRVKLPAISLYRLYEDLGFKGSKLPADMECTRVLRLKEARGEPLPIEPVTVWVLPSNPERGLHRVFVRCPLCSDGIPFGRFPSHYTSKRCDATAKAMASRIELPKDNQNIWTAGRFSGGYLVALFNGFGFHATAYKPDGTVIGRVSAALSDDSHFSMFYLNASAFADWFGELENLPPMGYLRPNRFQFWKAAFLGYAVSLRTVSLDDAERLSGNDSYRYKWRRPHETETDDERKERKRQQRRTVKGYRVEHLERLKRDYAWIL